MSRRLVARLAVVFSSILSAHAAFAGIQFVGAELTNVSPKPDYMVSGRLNNDDLDDVVVVSPSSKEINVYLAANTPSRFAPARVMRFGQTLRGATVADVNADGRNDILVTDQAASSVWVLIGRGDGTFLTPYQVAVPNSRNPVAVAVGNFDNAGNADLVVADRRLGRLFVLLNDNQTAPGFRRGGEVEIGEEPNDVRAVDVNGDGRPDLVSLNLGGPRVKEIAVSLWRRVTQGFPEFDTPQRFGIGENPSHLVIADFNNDGAPDLATLNRPAASGNTEIDVMLNEGTGIYFPPTSIPVPCPFFTGGSPCRTLALAAGDFDGNGNVDLMAAMADPRRSRGSASSLADAMQAFAGRGDGGFVPGPVFATQKAPAVMVAAELTGDGKLDIAVANDRTLDLQAFVNVSTAGGGPNGQECFLGDECLSNLCLNGRCCAASCDPLTNERCDVPGREGTCVPVGEAFECGIDEECLENEFCVDGFCCDQTCEGGRCDVEGFEGVCVPGLPLGEICNFDRECQSSFCSQNFVCCQEPCDGGWCDSLGTCHARSFDGEPCEDGFECLSNVCDEFDLVCCNRVCDPDSERCWLGEGPFLGRCVPLNFTPPPTATATPTPTQDLSLTPGAVGAPCEEPSDCNNGQCVDNVCCQEASCPVDFHCALGSGACVEGPPATVTATALPTNTPNACNDQCPTSRCVNGGCIVSSSSGGCSVGERPAAGNLVPLALLPLALWARRRWQLARVRLRHRAPRQ